MTNFKIGDWVKSTKHPHLRPIQINSIYESNTRPGILGLKFEGIVLYSDECELWQPQSGEWCWFLNYKNDLPRLRKFISASNPFDRPTVYTTHPDPTTKMSRAYCGIESYSYCEPFIGQLPTILKDNT